MTPAAANGIIFTEGAERDMIDEQSRREMRAVGLARDRAVVNNCGWKGDTSSRKALLIIVGEPSGRMLTLDDLREAVANGLPTAAVAGNSSSTIDITEVISGYDTDRELPVLFVEEDDGEELLSMFLYDIPVAA